MPHPAPPEPPPPTPEVREFLLDHVEVSEQPDGFVRYRCSVPEELAAIAQQAFLWVSLVTGAPLEHGPPPPDHDEDADLGEWLTMRTHLDRRRGQRPRPRP